MLVYESEVQHVLLGDQVPWEVVDRETGRRTWRPVMAVINRPYGAIELQTMIGGRVAWLHFRNANETILVRFEAMPPVEVQRWR